MNYEAMWEKLYRILSQEEALVQTPTGLWFKAYVKNQGVFVAAADGKSPGCRISKPRPITKEDFMMVASYRDGWIHNIAAEKQKAREASQNTAYIIGLMMKYEADKGDDIAEKKIINQLDAVIAEFEILEKEYREIHGQAVDIEDIQESKTIQERTYEKIRKIKDWKKRVYHFSEEIEEHLYKVFSLPANDVFLPVSEEALSDSRTIMFEVPAADESDEQSAGEVSVSEAVETTSAMTAITDDKAEDDSDNGQGLSADAKQVQTETVAMEIINELADTGTAAVDLSIEENPDSSDAPRDYADESIVDARLPDISDKPVSLDLFDSHEAVTGWDEILFKLCRILLLHRPYSVARLDKEVSLNSNGVVNFSYLESEIIGAKDKLPNGLWVSKANNNVATLNLCQAIFQLLGYCERFLIINFE